MVCNYDTLSKYRTAKILVDMFGQPVAVGDYVLTHRYGSATFDQIVQVKRVTKRFIWIPGVKYRKDPVSWGRTRIETDVKRDSWHFIKLSPQQVADIQSNADAFQLQHAELFI